MKNALCKDCYGNLDLRSEWDWYEIRGNLFSMCWVRYAVTLTMAGNAVYIVAKGLDFGGIVQVAGMAFSCFVMWRAFDKSDMKEALEASRQKMFLLKLGGKTERNER